MPAHPTPTSFLRRAPGPAPILSKATIEQLVKQKVSSILAAQRIEQHNQTPQNKHSSPPKDQQQSASSGGVSEEVQCRLASIEQRLKGQEAARAEGLSFQLMAKQHQARGEDGSALKKYMVAKPYFPRNEKLERKIGVLKERREGQLEQPAKQKKGGTDYEAEERNGEAD